MALSVPSLSPGVAPPLRLPTLSTGNRAGKEEGRGGRKKFRMFGLGERRTYGETLLIFCINSLQYNFVLDRSS